MRNTIFCFVTMVVTASTLFSQTMIIHLRNGKKAEYPIKEIDKITYSSMELPSRPTSVPIAYYPFNGSADDESGRGNDGIVNGASLTTDRFGNESSAYDFNGANNNIRIPYHMMIRDGISYTISAWFNANTVSTSIGGQAILGCRDGNRTPCVGIKFQKLWAASANGNEIILSGSEFEYNRWNFAAFVIDGRNVRFYLNGRNCGSAQLSQDSDPRGNASIGGTNDYWTVFNGKIDEVRIYDKALPESEIKALYGEGGRR